MEFQVGDKVLMKKIHACGGGEWQITRVGADFKIKCEKCGREVMLTRRKFEAGFLKKSDE